MLPLLRVSIGIALFAVASATAAQEFPKLKAGLWEVNMTTGKREGPPRLTTMCLDDSVQREMYKVSTGMMAGMCTKHEIKVAGNKVTTIANCDLRITKMRSHAKITITRNTSYYLEAL